MYAAWQDASALDIQVTLCLTSTKPQYNKILLIELPVQYMKTTSSEHQENMLCTQIFFDRELANAVQGITIWLVDLLPTFHKPFTQSEAYYVMLCNTSSYDAN